MRERLVKLHWFMARWSLLLLLSVTSLSSSAHAQTVPQVLESEFEWQRNSEDRSKPSQARNIENNPETELDLSDVPSDEDAHSFVLTATLETDRSSAYVNEQILLTLQVSAPAIAFNITGTQLRVANAELVSLHRQESVEHLNGIVYQISRTVFALFAKEPGTLQLPMLKFKAVLPVGEGGDTNPIIEDSTDAFQLSIDAAPSSDTLWFPAQAVELSSSWSVDTVATEAVSVYAGEPVTRHVTIQVAGQHPAAIPDSAMPAPEGVRTYPELARLETQLSPTGLNGTRVDSAAILASRVGAITLPAIEIQWWDINQREWRTSSLPAEQLRVRSANTDVAVTSFAPSRWYRQVLTGGSVAIAMLSVLCLLLWRSNRRLSTMVLPKQSTASHAKPTSEPVAWARLRRDIRRKDLPTIRDSLRSWGQSLGPTQAVQTLNQLAGAWPALKPMLQSLDAALYSQHADGTPALDQLLLELKRLRVHVKTRPAANIVSTSLYPE